MGNTNSTAAAGAEFEDAHQSLSRHVSRSPSLRAGRPQYDRRRGEFPAGGGGGGGNESGFSGWSASSSSPPRSRSRSSSLQGFWAARKASVASGGPQLNLNLPHGQGELGEPAISSPLRGKPTNATNISNASSSHPGFLHEEDQQFELDHDEFSGTHRRTDSGANKRRSKSIELPDLLGEPAGGFANATSVTGPSNTAAGQAYSIAQRRAHAQARIAATQGEQASSSSTSSAQAAASAAQANMSPPPAASAGTDTGSAGGPSKAAAGPHLHLPIPAAGFGPGGSAVLATNIAGTNFKSPLSSPVLGTDGIHAHGTVAGGKETAGSSRASSLSSASGQVAASGESAAAVAAAAAAAAVGAKGSKSTHDKRAARGSTVFSTDVGEASIYGEESFTGSGRQRSDSFNSLSSTGLMPPANDQLGIGGTDPLGRSLHTALPSYLKIPTVIPSENVAAPTVDDIADWRSSSPPITSDVLPDGSAALPGGDFAHFHESVMADAVPLGAPGVSTEHVDSPTATVSMLPHMISYTSATATAAATTAPLGSHPIDPEAALSAKEAAKRMEKVTAEEDRVAAHAEEENQRPTMLEHGSAGAYMSDLTQPLAGGMSSVSTAELGEQAEKPTVKGAKDGVSPEAEAVAKEREGSRTPTPTPGGGRGPRALTPTGGAGVERVRMSPAVVPPVDGMSDASAKESKAGGATPVYGFTPQTPTKLEGSGSGGKGSAATLKGLAVGMTPASGSGSSGSSAPASSTSTPAKHHHHHHHGHALHHQPFSHHHHQRHHHLSHPSSAAAAAGGPQQHFYRPNHVPLMPIVITWRAGGREVFVTGTFANEWRSKIPLRRSKRDHTCILHLPPGTHRLKFIVDDRWRVSKDLPTASDGDGNLVNYVEIPNVGPAHPGPLSAPGEEMLGDPADVHPLDAAAMAAAKAAMAAATGTADGATLTSGTGRMAAGGERRGKTALDAHRSTWDLQEEARRAEILRRGELDDVFADMEGTRKQITWTRDIPQAVLAAQEAEEAAQQEGANPNADIQLPYPPALPRQLEKVILNSTPATNSLQAGGAVDDNSVLPAPNHVVLNHLTASAIKSGVLAVGTTTRYKRKYVTTVLYKPVTA